MVGGAVSDASRHLPGSLRLASIFPFVGRSTELGILRTLVPSAEGEGRRVVLLAGEPGSGKSRLVRELAADAADHGALVLYGACDAVVRAPYGPFAEALAHLARVTPPDELRSALSATGTELLSRLVPGIAGRGGQRRISASEADPDTERHRLHTAVVDLLTGLSRRQPILLVVEDGHWADEPSLLLLRHLVRSSGGARLMIVATFRDTEADVPEGLAETLADLRRSEDVVRMRLGGLSSGEIAEFVARAADCEAGPETHELADAISKLTEGNAFLVCELWRALVETGVVEIADGTLRVTRPPAELGTPESVREVASQRLARLAPHTTELLEVAATAGAEFELELVRHAAGLAEPQLVAALDEAVASGMLVELPGRGLAWRFTHELVRRALYDRLSSTRRAELHLRVGEALEAHPRSARGLADLAHHFVAAAPLGRRERAVDYSLRAARAATDALAFDEAARLLRAAIELGIDDPESKAEVYLELGTASHKAGKALDALSAFQSTAELARELGSAELLARAAFGYEEACWRPAIIRPETVDLLEEAIAALGEAIAELGYGSPALRVGLLSGLARALDLRGRRERGAIVRMQAVELARDLGDRAALAKLLVRSYWSRGTSSLEEILEMLTEGKQLADELDDTEIRAEAMAWRVPTFVGLCDMDSARREVGALLETAEQTAQPFMSHVAEHYASAIALCDGRLAEAELMANRSADRGRFLTGRDASGSYGIQMFSIRREQGRLAELAPAIRILAAGSGGRGAWRPGLTALLVELGMEAEARRALVGIASEGLDQFRPSLWLAALAYLTDACTALHEREVAALVYPELEPFAGANVMIGHLVSCYGAADRYLGMLAATLGWTERAELHFENALALNRRMGAWTWLAHTAYEYARFLLASGVADDRTEALVSEASELAEQIGMNALVAKIDALGVTATRAELPGGLSPREAQILDLVAHGLSNREIGDRLSISEHTAANHIRSILRKTDSANRAEAAAYAQRHGLVSR
jgi:DNA-binding CsgD family transcriptional regulator/tetratricopeptide (TPR) repeat protein